MTLKWQKVIDKSGLVNPYVIKESTGRYTVSRAFNGTRDIFTAWRRSVSIRYGTAEECKQACYEDSLKPESQFDRELALEALMNARELLR